MSKWVNWRARSRYLKKWRPRPNKITYIELLGVPRKAPLKELRAALPQIGAQVPSRSKIPGDKSAEEKFKQIQEAYEILSDTKKRQI